MFSLKSQVKVKVVIPLNEFRGIYDSLQESENCRRVWCEYSRTTCHVREACEALRKWWKKENGDAPGFSAYEKVLKNAITFENRLYWCFWTRRMKPCEEMHAELATQVREAFLGRPVDRRMTCPD